MQEVAADMLSDCVNAEQMDKMSGFGSAAPALLTSC